MAGFDRAAKLELDDLIVSIWTDVTVDKIFQSQSLNRANWENLQNSGALIGPFVVVAVGSSQEVDAVPVGITAYDHSVSIILVRELDDPAFLVDPLAPADGIDYVSAMSGDLEALRTPLARYDGSRFRCAWVGKPTANVSEFSPPNAVYYQLLDGKFAGQLVCNLRTATLYDPRNP
ncbi:hypothetical protein [Fimbriimonas ginsengisoli]|uniref:Uncharacterized protein n=1 Tax=Fimbriimonas ginsengisoli Gsoil 348 TaxID=661478 RepID=A0A068NJ51_FIMGI|nr:hypothetical protein [Fimbriimonas ginsengisoli]AIE83531.1 hypothetical protein OP10G_0163 [Fimbriimonas ginsengisoli Gsoil 348]